MIRPLLAVAILLFLAMPAPAEEPEPHPHADTLKKKVTEWLSANNALGPQHQLVSDMTANVGKVLSTNHNFILVVGSGLTKSKKGTMLASWGPEMFVFELTKEQFEKSKVSAGGAKVNRGIAEQRPVESPLTLKVKDVELKDKATKVKGMQPLLGSIDLESIKQTPADVSVRCIYQLPGGITNMRFSPYDRYGNFRTEEKFALKFKPLLEETDKYTGPVILFFDVVAKPNRMAPSEVVLLSRAKAMLIDLE